ncbi:hypothetical protein DM01DRAFT_257469 [Hesseltinella vesiculosa]|uniref:Transcription factor domain-containing protein n=1 Tax=Hesseltinella vesiculosa TaxID=101127 RepID=A0A1X2GEQ8_9FUNG|nr:hypothetical protein DM01DRAFT_257469 [Hesseltinella vesiculosa]
MEALVRPCKQHKSKLAILTTTAGQPCRVGKADVQQGQCPPCNAAELPLSLPNKVRDTIESSYLLQSLMERAKNHWCCIGFKVAPVTIDAIQNWKSAPVPIVYCVASIALVTFLDHQADPAFVKTAAMAFYQEARQKMDDFLFDEDDDAGHQYFTDDDDDTMTPRNHMTIQSYFCLSYTSNLLRLYDQQRTWGSLASIALQLRTKDAMSGYSPLPKPILLCFLRWYYVDAWMALTLRRETLVRDHPPVDLQLALISDPEHASLYHFATMTMFMRRYIHAMRNGQLMDPKTQMPTFLYHQITEESQRWYAQLNRNNSGRRDEHLHICYNAMRLVVMFQFLHPKNPPLDDGLVKDILETNLALLGSLQELSSLGCDQSTYHHMFFAIHNVACRIYLYYRHKRPSYRDGFSPIMSKWRKFSREQLRINLCLLKSTQAYANDVYQMRDYAKMIEEKFELIDIKPLPAILPLELAHSMAQSRMDADTPLPFSPNDGIISDGGSSPVSASSWASSVCSSPTPNSQPSHCPRSSITKPVKTRKSPHVKMKEVLGLPGVSVFEWKNARRRCKKSTASPPRRQPLPNALL